MKKSILLFSSVILLLAAPLVMTNAQIQEKGKSTLDTITNPAQLPASLNDLYPPRAKQPVYLFRMYDISESLAGIVADLFENDFENAESNYENFKTKYVELSRLVPEWTEYFPLAPVEKLSADSKTNDPDKVMPAVEQVGEICNECHFAYMPQVQHKFHWRNFQSITMTDPLTNETVSFSRIMQYLDTNLTGIKVDLIQGQIENARKQHQAFQARFQAFSELCMDCHDSERHYYTDESVNETIQRLGEALKADNIEPELVGRYSQEIGTESCFKCHLVHVPAAATQWQMAK
jgi:hypothetical protein